MARNVIAARRFAARLALIFAEGTGPQGCVTLRATIATQRGSSLWLAQGSERGLTLCGIVWMNRLLFGVPAVSTR
jgi:hypothetical protein